MLLPPRRVAMALRAALLTGEPAQEALAAWLAAVGGSLDNLWRSELATPSLLALLDDGSTRNRIEFEGPLRQLVRATAAREAARAGRVAAACHDALSALDRAAIPAVVLRGVALAHTAYERPGLRHCHDLDLLVRADDLGRAREALAAYGDCVLVQDRLAHRSKLPIALHTQITAARDGAAGVDAVWSRSGATELAGAPALTLDPMDELLALCAHSSACPRRSSQWALDAMMLVRAAPLDWEAAIARGPELRSSAPAALMLRWLKDELRAPVPDDVISGLAAIVDRAAGDVLLDQARQAVGVVALLSQLEEPRERLRLLLKMTFPAEEFLRLSGESGRALPYLRRTARASRGAARQLRARATASH